MADSVSLLRRPVVLMMPSTLRGEEPAGRCR